MSPLNLSIQSLYIILQLKYLGQQGVFTFLKKANRLFNATFVAAKGIICLKVLLFLFSVV